MRPGLVIFDCDGVLVDSELLTNRVLQRNLAGFGFDMPVDQIMSLFVGGTMAGVRSEVIRRGIELPGDWVVQINKEVAAVLARDVQKVEGIETVLDALDEARVPYAVGSNGPMMKMRASLGQTGLWNRMQGRIYTAHDCAAPKPAPDVYLKAAGLSGIAPANCVVIEDSASGARAAKAAQMRCFGYHADTPREKLAPHCDALFTQMSELPVLLKL